MPERWDHVDVDAAALRHSYPSSEMLFWKDMLYILQLILYLHLLIQLFKHRIIIFARIFGGGLIGTAPPPPSSPSFLPTGGLLWTSELLLSAPSSLLLSASSHFRICLLSLPIFHRPPRKIWDIDKKYQRSNQLHISTDLLSKLVLR